MSFFETTSSFTTVAQRVVNTIQDNYVRCGMNVMVRKFDPAVVTSSLWNELWIGLRWRISSSYAYQSQSFLGTAIDPFGEFSTFEFGLCNTTGSVHGQHGQIDASHQHSIGYRKCAQSGVGTTYWELSTSGSGPYTMATGGGRIIHRVTGSLKEYNNVAATNRHVRLFVNTAYFTASYRSAFVLRIFTSSVDRNLCRASVIYPDDTNATAMRTDFSSSAMLADIMGAGTWNQATASAATYGYINSELAEDVPISQSINGYFDGMYFSWRRLYDNLEISDIVIRKK